LHQYRNVDVTLIFINKYTTESKIHLCFPFFHIHSAHEMRTHGLLYRCSHINNRQKKGKVQTMEFFSSGVDLLQKLVTAIGGGLVVVGLVQFMLAQKDHDAGGKSTAVNMLMGGGGLALIGMILVPMLKTLFT